MSKTPPIGSLSFRDGYANVYTPPCGCCSEWYSEDDDYSPDWPFSVDDLIKHVETEEARVEALRDKLNTYLSRKDN